MARILFAWELGWQLSHLANIEMLARRLHATGHEIAVAARELQEAARFFAGMRVQYYQAPFKQGPSPELPAYLSYAHLLHSAGHADPRELSILVSAWLGVLHAFRPDLVVFDHSPTALLASRALDVKRAIVGSGFLVPPHTCGAPLGILPDVPRSPERLKALQSDEAAVLAVVNRAAAALGIAPLERLGSLYDDADARILLTFAELDPFPERVDPEYAGVWSSGRAEAARWEGEEAPRIFAYLSRFEGCEALLSALTRRGGQVQVFAPALPADVRRRVEGERLRFLDDLVDLFALSEGCDLFVSHAAHSSLAATLLGGVPQLMIPLYREQALTARRVVEIGAGRRVAASAGTWDEEIAAALDDPAPRAGARRFATRYRGFDRKAAADAAARRLASLC